MIKIASCCFLLASCAAAYGTSVTAGTPCPSTPTSLAVYIRAYSTSGCSVGIVDYTNFQFLDPSASGIPAATAEQVYLTPVGLGFAFSYAGVVPDNASSVFTVRYDFDPPPALGDATLLLDPPQGDVFFTEQICPGGTFTGTDGPGTCMIQASDPNPIVLVVYPEDPEDSEPLGVSNGEINLNFDLSGDEGPASFDSLIVDFAPEPGTVALLLIGGAALLIGKRRSAAKRQ